MTDLHTVLRWIVVVVVLIGAVMLLGVLLSVAGGLLGLAFKALLLLLLVAIVLRFFEQLKGRR